jgi:hypothetical protein
MLTIIGYGMFIGHWRLAITMKSSDIPKHIARGGNIPIVTRPPMQDVPDSTLLCLHLWMQIELMFPFEMMLPFEVPTCK